MAAYEVVPLRAFADNYIWTIRDGQRAAVVDPGGDLDRILKALADTGATLEKILLTHGHLDHCGGADALRARTGVPIEGPQREDAFWIAQLAESSARHGFQPAQEFTPDRWLEDGDAVTVGNAELQVRHCPGHTPGHVVFVSTGERIAFVGDSTTMGWGVAEKETFANQVVEMLARQGYRVDGFNEGVGNWNTTQELTNFREVGAKMNRVQTGITRLEDEHTMLQTLVSNEQDVDLAQSIVELQAKETTLQAALGAAGRALNLSLLEFLR